MKFAPKNSQLFSDISSDLGAIYPELNVSHLAHWDPQMKASHILVEDSLENAEIIAQIREKKIHHLVQKNENRFSDQLLLAAKLIAERPEYFLKSNSVLDRQLVDACLIPFAGAQDKPRLREKCSEFFEKLGRASIAESAMVVVEELYMNAAIDAPKEAMKQGIPAHSEPAELFLAYDGKDLQISCTDSYGSLDIAKFIGRMNEVYEKGAGEVINLNRGSGAGLGCVIIFEQCSTLILGVRPGAQTKVSAVIPVNMGNRQRAQLKKSLHWFQHQDVK
jgi:hypothetical protein